ncbi:MAG: SAVED domain-containing protein, partial [Vicinamibacteria bacterium]
MKRTKPRRANSLFAPRERGGVIGGLGYKFQDAYIVTVLPQWLADPGFRSFIKEGFDDVDVVLTSAGAASTRHYQLKDHEVSLAEFREVIGDFAVAARRPGVNATSFVLGCCGLAPKVRALWPKIQELRGAQKTHSDAALEGTRAELLGDLRKLGVSAHADLLLDAVEIDYETPGLRAPDARTLKERFRGAFMVLPFYRGEDAAVLDRLFEGLMIRVNKAVRIGISREDVEGLITTELAAAVKGRAVVVYLHGWARQAYDLAADEQLDWTRHFDHATLRVPPVDVWERELLPGLRALRDRLDRDGHRRMIWLRARAPLSAGLAFGHAFAEAAGYGIRVQQPSPGAKEALQYWETDSPVAEAEILACREIEDDPSGDEIVVGIGVTDDPEPKIGQYLASAGLKVRASLFLSPAGGASATALDAQTVGAFALAAKREIRRACNRYSPRLIHFFYFGPLG